MFLHPSRKVPSASNRPFRKDVEVLLPSRLIRRFHSLPLVLFLIVLTLAAGFRPAPAAPLAALVKAPA
ncbi:MAG: hypothetical protein ACTHJ3_10040, partial [Pararhizobium sp.]